MYIEYLSEADFRLFIKRKMQEKYGKCEVETVSMAENDEFKNFIFNITSPNLRRAKVVKATFTDCECMIKEDLELYPKMYKDEWVAWLNQAVKYKENQLCI